MVHKLTSCMNQYWIFLGMNIFLMFMNRRHISMMLMFIVMKIDTIRKHTPFVMFPRKLNI